MELPASSSSEGEEAVADAIVEASSDAVEIARIEAEKEVTVAAINAGTEEARIEQQTELEAARLEIEKERVTWQEERVMELEKQVQELRELVLNSSIQQPLQELAEEVTAETMEALSETPPEPSLTHPFTQTPPSEIETEVSVENGEEKVVVEATATRRFTPI